jgi:hypothetical protein
MGVLAAWTFKPTIQDKRLPDIEYNFCATHVKTGPARKSHWTAFIPGGLHQTVPLLLFNRPRHTGIWKSAAYGFRTIFYEFVHRVTQHLPSPFVVR